MRLSQPPWQNSLRRIKDFDECPCRPPNGINGNAMGPWAGLRVLATTPNHLPLGGTYPRRTPLRRVAQRRRNCNEILLNARFGVDMAKALLCWAVYGFPSTSSKPNAWDVSANL